MEDTGADHRKYPVLHPADPALFHCVRHLLHKEYGEIHFQSGEFHHEVLGDHFLPGCDPQFGKEQSAGGLSGRDVGHDRRSYHGVSPEEDTAEGQKDSGFPDRTRFRNAQCGDRAGAHHDHERKIRDQYLQYDLDHDRGVYGEIYDDGHAAPGLRFLTDRSLPGGGSADLRGGMAAQDEGCDPAAAASYGGGRLVPDLHAQLLRADHVHTALQQQDRDAGRTAF